MFSGGIRPLTVCRRFVTTWTPLGSTFNRKPQRKLSFTFGRNAQGLFGIPALNSPSGFAQMREEAERDAERLVREATDTNRTRNVVGIFDELSDALCKVADLAECIRMIHPNGKYVSAADQAHADINGLVEELNTNKPLYESMKNALEKGDVKPMDDIDRHVAKLFLVDFEQCGIHLDLETRNRVVDLTAAILSAGSTFMRRGNEPKYVRSSVVPSNIHQYFHKVGDNLVVGHPMSEHPVEQVREAAYKVYFFPDKKLETPLLEMVSKRHELAKLVGFSSFSERANRGSVFENPAMIRSFLDALSQALRPLADEDMKDFLYIKQRMDTDASQVYPWDTSFLTGVGRQAITDLHGGTDFSPYFPLGACMEGLNQLFSTLYNVGLVHEELDEEDVWSNDVYKLSVRDLQDGKTLGYIYCDFYERDEKTPQDCHFTVRCGRELQDGSYQLPIVVLSLNLNPPSGGKPCLLNPWQIDNLFHEMGHAMHSMLGRTRYQHVTGTRCTTDFAEIPSTLMEYFATDARVLASISRHHKTGESLSPDLIQPVLNSRKLFSATELQMQVFYSVLDQELHGPVRPVDTVRTYADLHDKYVSVKHVPNTAWHLRFGHLFGYGARYYSYLLARAVASQIWKVYFDQNPYNREGGHHVRYDLLRHGGGKPALELVSSVLGRAPTVDELVDAVISRTRSPVPA